MAEFFGDTFSEKINKKTAMVATAIVFTSSIAFMCILKYRKANKRNRKKIKKLEKKSLKTPNGLANLGNSCYMNSVFQCLRSSEYFKYFLRSCKTNTANSGSFKYFLQQIICEEKDEIFGLKHAISLVTPHYGGFEQEDAQEFLSTVLNLVPNEKNPFVGKMQFVQACYSCNYTKQPVFSTFDSLSLALNHEENDVDLTIEKLLFFFFNNFSNDIACNRCSQKTKIDKIDKKLSKFKEQKDKYGDKIQMLEREKEKILESPCKKIKNLNKFKTIGTLSTICEYPQVLCIHLKRGLFYNKNDSFVQFDLNIDFKAFDIINEDSNHRECYSLIGVVEHKGGCSMGHYIAYAKREQSQWFFFSDRDVRKVQVQDVLRANAYMLFYEKVHDDVG